MKKAIVLLVILCGLGIYFMIDPESVSFMPRCVFHWCTGLDCPACGTQRAMHQLLHGHLREAFAYNPFLLISLPYLGGLILCRWFNNKGWFDGLKRVCYHPVMVNIYLILLVAWWIGRNIWLHNG
ncbi:MAG TPA: DUF2752 domain-containing protein [Candidatus Barnesiella merdipullorum]|nr:hypothetical protein B5G10_09900 [Barnesiella sp. An55]HIZ27341.1 DUF2752 domain-containing protein [Candidatus Barnesiella merdipullorum]